MNFIALFTTLIAGQSLRAQPAFNDTSNGTIETATSRTTITLAEGNKIAEIMNNVRSGVLGSTRFPPSINSRYITYNNPMAQKAATWFNSGANGMTNGDLCWQQGDLCRSMMRDPAFQAEKAAGWEWFIFDSTNNNGGSVQSNFIQRAVRQHLCFDYARCNPLPAYWYGYRTCQSNPIPPSVRHCNNFYDYLPHYLLPEIGQIACIKTGKPGPYNPGGTVNSFYCVVQKLDKHGLPFFNFDPIDQPYKAAKTAAQICSDCPDAVPFCFQNLCIAELPPTQAPSRFPTNKPTKNPTTKKPTRTPTQKPSRAQTKSPTVRLTGQPTHRPSKKPKTAPSFKPTMN